LVSDNAFRHEQNLRYGQNLFEITGGRASPQQVVDAWASERKEYDARSGTCTGRCGHFTQIVWRTAEEVGCGSAHRGDREVWVCDYSPPGNIVGERPF
jgi:hypothetical protein